MLAPDPSPDPCGGARRVDRSLWGRRLLLSPEVPPNILLTGHLRLQPHPDHRPESLVLCRGRQSPPGRSCRKPGEKWTCSDLVAGRATLPGVSRHLSWPGFGSAAVHTLVPAAQRSLEECSRIIQKNSSRHRYLLTATQVALCDPPQLYTVKLLIRP